ncbi:MAG TPA: hypothetical protein VLE93_01380 [Candidatus Saccharimonadales bacterium]|nr:hypothetical protein [Candidatus Saccharimonadales bacterium]
MEHFPQVDRLHTDVLEDKYGPIHAEVLHHDTEYREALLNDENNIARTYALTFFTEKQAEEIQKIDEIIRDGGAIGKTFRDFGYSIRKNVIDAYLLETNPWLQGKFNVTETQAKTRLSEFLAAKEDGMPVVYGTVMEAYTPDFRPPEINQVDRAQVSAPIAWLEHHGVSREDVWKRIGNNNDWTGLEDIIKKSQAESHEWIDYYHKLVEYYLGQHS